MQIHITILNDYHLIVNFKRHNFCDATKKITSLIMHVATLAISSNSKKNHAMPTESNIPFCFYY